jgi:PhzF family phenazine biosynthesis protein
MKLPIYQVDAFTDQVFGGNPAAVIPLKEWLPDETMQQIAMENNLSETAFFVPKDGGYHIRWFTPKYEVDLCGHATLATAHVLWNELNYAGELLSFQSRSGALGVKKSGNFYTLDFPTDTIRPVETPEEIKKGLGIDAVETYFGREDYLVILPLQKDVEDLQPDFRLIGQLKVRGVIATSVGRDTDFVSRGFFPYYGIDEDPVTGSAHTTLAPYWSKKLGKNEMTARQISARGGFLKINHIGDRTEISGQARTYMKGEIGY